MKRHTLPVSVAIGATAAILLSACSGNADGTKRNGKIAGEDTSDTRALATPSASVSDKVKRPDSTLPKGVNDVFEGWHTGDPTEDAVLADAARSQTAMNYAILEGDSNTPGMTFYYKEKALTSSMKWVQKWLDTGLTYTGTTRYFKPKINVFDSRSAGVSFCADESKAFNKDRKTGTVDRSPVGNDAYVLYNTRLERNEQGIWQTTDGTSVRGSKMCLQ
ncbi:hypothetical protein ACWD5R_00445 [Streptomyces sp. NPDC002514]|uniref:hypothetical protein n=1 Tax=unclassified Streptomyces TaxID=2593676 RepID=UPI0036C684AF